MITLLSSVSLYLINREDTFYHCTVWDVGIVFRKTLTQAQQCKKFQEKISTESVSFTSSWQLFNRLYSLALLTKKIIGHFRNRKKYFKDTLIAILLNTA